MPSIDKLSADKARRDFNITSEPREGGAAGRQPFAWLLIKEKDVT